MSLCLVGQPYSERLFRSNVNFAEACQLLAVAGAGALAEIVVP